jgi:hypothetical protein
MMRLIQTTMMGASLCFSLSGFAASGWQRMKEPPSALPRYKARSVAGAAGQSCADFSGQWQGQCDEEPESYTLNLRQEGCAALTVETTRYVLGGANTSNQAVERHQSVEFTNFDWSGSFQELTWSWHVIDKELGSRGTTQGRATGHMSKSGDNTLVVRTVSDWFTDSSDTPWSYQLDSRCVYQRLKQ